MKQTKLAPLLTRIVFTSPWFLLIFLIVPGFTVASHLLHRPYHQNLLLINNISFLVCIALRLCWYLARLWCTIRYGAGHGRPQDACELELAAATLRERLSGAGYRFAAGGGYGEKRDPGYFGTALVYAGLLLTLSFGCYDNLRQFAGQIVTGVGDPVPLNEARSYSGETLVGPWATPGTLPQLQIKQMIVTDKSWPDGAARIGLISDEGIELADGFVSPGKPLHYQDYEFHLARFRFRAAVVVKEKDQKVFGGVIEFRQMPVRQNGFDYYGSFPRTDAGNVTGDAWYNPGTRSLRVIAAKDGKQVMDSTLQMSVKARENQGEYGIELLSLGEAPQIDVVRSRHMRLIVIGAVIALLGGLLRLAFRPQRVWVEDAGEGCRVKTAGKSAGKLVRVLGKG
ncbi:MAG: hypothetical protein P4L44_13635 [Oryzomonas sp.]|uniref:hypothetical protein n=1 Tax=Oryzomonas sp. TaxID=2855186 RepID=UPI00283B8677|nr:hypothetical protein [Oryzomonas sp.]MDR3580997.1 hypothetical protein [Oryzomonas sp.]